MLTTVYRPRRSSVEVSRGRWMAQTPTVHLGPALKLTCVTEFLSSSCSNVKLFPTFLSLCFWPSFVMWLVLQYLCHDIFLLLTSHPSFSCPGNWKFLFLNPKFCFMPTDTSDNTYLAAYLFPWVINILSFSGILFSCVLSPCLSEYLIIQSF